MSEIATQPADSKIEFVEGEKMLTFAVPKTGFKGAALVFLILGLVWGGITGFIFLVFLVILIGSFNWVMLLPLIFLAVFGALGLAFLLVALQLAYRKAVILATPEVLVYTQTGPIRRKREYQWAPGELAAIRTDLSGTVINNVRLRELKIITTAGQSRGFFNGRSNPELDWLAATLSNFYNLPNSTAIQ